MSTTPTTTRKGSTDLRVDLYRDAERRWRWRARANGHVLADSGEGYSRRIDCLRGAMRVVGASEIVWANHAIGRACGGRVEFRIEKAQ